MSDRWILDNTDDLSGRLMDVKFIRVQAAADRYRWGMNPKLHDIGTICRSIARYGFIDWPKLDKHLHADGDTTAAGALVYGNGRIEALAHMERDGWPVPDGVFVHRETGDWYVPVLAGLDTPDAPALAIDHNTLTLQGGDFDDSDGWHLYDRDELAAIGKQLHHNDTPPLTLDGDGLDALMAYLAKPQGPPSDDGGGQPEQADELHKVWQIQPGERIAIESDDGRLHYLLCGDATDRAAYTRLLGDTGTAHMLITDPPYGVDYDGGHFHSGDPSIKRPRKKLANDTGDIYAAFLPVVRDFFDGPGYVFYAGTRGYHIFSALESAGYDIHSLIIWHKTNATYAAMGANYKQRHEVALYIKPSGATLRWAGPTDECSVWDMKRESSNRLHPTQKPLALIERAISNHDVRTVIDPFAGSGTTLAACDRLGRVGYAMEIDPRFCAVIVQRMADMGCTIHRDGV